MEEFYESTFKGCAFPAERDKIHTAIYWIVANDAENVTVVEKRSGCKWSGATFGCGCSKKTMPMEDVGTYLESMYATGSFKKLVLVGDQSVVHRLRHFLPKTMIPLITTEIIERDE